ncbi:MAG TPA: carboxypeptidase regulatory-like domain-containing protein [Terracidiphilus sp.]|nr:carboxypeptidase regulatory-like domain-containing protein [Terracidiphilus sp.]
MRLRELAGFVACAVFTVVAGAQSVSGTILIKKRLTKPRVTPDVSVYQRGTTVKLGKDPVEDPLEFERTRVVVYLEGPVLKNDDPANRESVQIEQINRRFSPDLVVVPVGSTVSFPNMDPIFHNIYSLSKPKTFDLGSYDRGQTRKVQFPKPGIVSVYCHLHPNMAATIVVTPNRWYARPDRTGQYRIDNVPPGQYTVVAWHKTAGFFRKTIVVRADQNESADFFIPVEADSTQDAELHPNANPAGGSQ